MEWSEGQKCTIIPANDLIGHLVVCHEYLVSCYPTVPSSSVNMMYVLLVKVQVHCYLTNLASWKKKDAAKSEKDDLFEIRSVEPRTFIHLELTIRSYAVKPLIIKKMLNYNKRRINIRIRRT